MSELILMTNLLAKSIWSNQDIKSYVGCGDTTASKIHREAATKYNGVIKLFPAKVRRDAVLAALGLSFKEEIEKIKLLSN